jgi:G3E family GTPase
LYKANRHFVESQVQNADVVLLNKCDKVDRTSAMLTRSAISAINPEISVLMAEFGAVDWGEYHLALSAAPHSKRTHLEHEREALPEAVESTMTEVVSQGHAHFHENENALGYESYGCAFGDLLFDRTALEAFFQQMREPDSRVGQVVRAKGIFRFGERGFLMELASGEFSFQPLGQVKESKISIIGKELNRELIGAALVRCVVA